MKDIKNLKWEIEGQTNPRTGVRADASAKGEGVEKLARAIVEQGVKVGTGGLNVYRLSSGRRDIVASTRGIFLDYCALSLRQILLPHLVAEQRAII